MKKAQMFYLDFFIAIGIFISGFLVFVLIFNSQNYSHNSLDEKLEVFSNEILNDKIISINMSFEEHQIFFIMNLNESINNNFEVKSFYGNCGNGIEVINSQKINLAYYGNNFRNINKSWINYTNFTTFDNLDYLIIDNETFISTKNLEDFVYSGKSVFIINSSNENLFEHNFSRGLFVNNEFLISKLSQDKNNTYRFLINSNVSWYKENESFGYGFGEVYFYKNYSIFENNLFDKISSNCLVKLKETPQRKLIQRMFLINEKPYKVIIGVS